MVRKTRHGSGDADRAVGGAAELPEADLPLLKEVLAKAKQIQDSLTHDNLGRDVSTKEVIDKVYDNVFALYVKVSSNLPLISERQAKVNLLKLYKDHKALVRSRASSTAPKMQLFQSKLDRIFDVIACKCEIKSCESVACQGCAVDAHITCKCKKAQKIPVTELLYVMDQRSRVDEKGSLQMGKFDVEEVERMEKNIAKKLKENSSSLDNNDNFLHKKFK